MNPKLLPEQMKKLIAPGERKKLGIHTKEELAEKIEAKLERDLHNQICQLLNQKGIVYCHANPARKSRITVGWPDFTFSILLPKPSKVDPSGKIVTCIPFAWECKIGNNELNPDQEKMRHKMRTAPNAWCYQIIRSLQQACDELKALGI